MADEILTLEKKDGIFLLTLKKADNRFNPDFFKAIHAALDEVEKSEGATALITQSTNPKIFSNGLDVQWIATHADQAGNILIEFQRMLARFLSLNVPSIACINGHAFAGGCMLALVHDYRVMRSGRGFLCINEIDIGLGLCPGMNAVVQCKMAPHVYRDAVFRAKRFTAEEALKCNLIDVIADEKDLLAKTWELAKQVAPKGEDRLVYSILKKEAYRNTIDLCLHAGLGHCDVLAGRFRSML
eukprot:GILI01019233.1.p1 GENE.GILI01019233.1~~GILI01019233.1.p1  ORF type:complete len:242 (-),score=52.63 GILI01019233.1:933-1658(-)